MVNLGLIDKILARGQGYVNEVLTLKHIGDNRWLAFVRGTHHYKVDIQLSINGENMAIKQMHCTCEYWDNCKHQVAVLIQLSRQIDAIKNIQADNNINFKEILKNCDKTTLINFILTLNQTQSIENDFILFLNKNTQTKTNDSQINRIIQQKISDILTLDDENEWGNLFLMNK